MKLHMALTRIGLHGHFINLIHACITAPSFSVIINGQSYENFTSSRGVRQGCPISPYLFVLAINKLSIQLQHSLAQTNLNGITLGPDCPPIHSLLFADDLLICGNATEQEGLTIKHILQNFCQQSGQIPNWTKSRTIFSKAVDNNTQGQFKTIFLVLDINESFIHLGHPLILPPKNRSEAYNFVLA
jgi:hypothetical protein